MQGFGVWLWHNRDRGPDTELLAGVADQLGSDWPIESADQADYERAIGTLPQESERTPALAALQQAWPTYVAARPKQPRRRLTWSFFANPLWAVTVCGVVLVGLFFLGLQANFLTSLAKPDTARGLITFLFAVTTVGIAVIVVLAVFLGSGSDQELDARFQRGKDILTILIGVFGAILGFYFGTAQQQPQPQNGTEEEVVGAPVSESTTAGATGAAPPAPQ
jgi:hypothetical protein